MNKILYMGSSPNAIKIHKLDKTLYSNIVGVNNTWKLFTEENPMDYWIYSGDFPYENRPKNTKIYRNAITHPVYTNGSANILKKLGIQSKFPDQYVGYTIFFQGLYWIMDTLKPDEIHLLGFEHNYNSDKTQKWIDMNMPSPHNKFHLKSGTPINEWAETTFKEYTPDFFYGHGTPDPLRLGEYYLRDKFNLSKQISDKLNIVLFNISQPNTAINTIPVL